MVGSRISLGLENILKQPPTFLLLGLRFSKSLIQYGQHYGSTNCRSDCSTPTIATTHNKSPFLPHMVADNLPYRRLARPRVFLALDAHLFLESR
jgi:hypothetical protein